MSSPKTNNRSGSANNRRIAIIAASSIQFFTLPGQQQSTLLAMKAVISRVISVQDLLDSLGRPPAEICIDWAWQLQELDKAERPAVTSKDFAEASPGDTHKPVMSPGGGMSPGCGRQLTWEEVVIDDQGRLSARVSRHREPDTGQSRDWTAPSPRRMDALMSDLMTWFDEFAEHPHHPGSAASSLVSATIRAAGDISGQEGESSSVDSQSEPLVRERETLSAEIAANEDQASLFEEVSSPASVKESDGNETDKETENETHKETGDAASRRLSSDRSQRTARKGLPRNQRGPELLQRLKLLARQRPQLVAGLALAVLSSCVLLGGFQAGWFSNRAGRNPDSLAALGNTGNTTEASGIRAEERFDMDAPHADEALTLLPELELGLADLDQPARFDSNSEIASNLGNALGNLEFDPLRISDRELLQESLPPQSSTNSRTLSGASPSEAPGSTSPTNGKQVAGQAAPEAPSRLDAIESAEAVDVMSELAAIAKKSEDAETVSALDAGVDHLSSASRQPAFYISTYPMVQTQRLPLAAVSRAKQPSWKLRLAVSEGFEINPAGPVEVGAAATANWRISSKQIDKPEPQIAESKSPKVGIVVQVQPLGKRGNALRWRVAAVPEDMPQAYFPMGQQYLDLLQANLSLAVTRLQFGVDQLKMLSKTSGLPAAVRSNLAQQRKDYELQLELVSQLHSVAAEANLMEGWLDGQIEVHAQFFDLASPDSTSLLQFGQIEGTLGASVPSDSAENIEESEVEVPK